ncbi:MAG TPA: alpha/beta hydrolase [Chthoniobacter sp.]
MPTLTPTIVPRRSFRRLWGTFLILSVIAFLLVNGAAYLAARSMTHYVENVGRPHFHVPMTPWDKTRFFLGTLALPRPENHATPADRRLEYETVHFPGAHRLQIEAWRIPGKEGQPVVLLFPGYCASKESLLGYAREFHGLGYEAWLVDFHGTGGSQGNTTTIGWEEADDVAAAGREAARLRPGAPQLYFGMSLGAAAILRAEHLRSITPAALILESPYDRLLTTVDHRFSALGIPAFPLANLLVFWGGEQLGFDGFAMNPVDYARDVRCPTLLFAGEKDFRVGVPNARAIAQALGSHGTFELLAGQGHASYLTRTPDEWRQSVHSFLGTNLGPLR